MKLPFQVGFLTVSLYAAVAWSSIASGYVTQETLRDGPEKVFDAGLFTPLGSLDVLSETHFTTLKHGEFLDHRVRIKKTKFCDGTVDSYTGYIDVGARHLFFYFFESRSDPDKDDVILWTNGGPGASSSLGLFMEQGPCRVVDANTTRFHPESWNSKANMFFIDQPVGVGWSYADYGEHVGTTEEAAQDIAAFIVVFFEHFHKFKGRAFHMAGESYGGRYIPVYAAAVYDQNKELVKKGLPPINLNSIMIGLNPSDITVECEGKLEETICYPVTQSITEYLSRPEIRQLIGAEHDIQYNFTAQSWTVRADFEATLDQYRQTYHYVSNLLDRGIRVLVYVGMNDFTCNHIGNERWTTALEWSEQDGYRSEPMRDWYVNGREAGGVRSYGGLTFVTLDGAGHMAPFDKPIESLELVNRWMAGDNI